MLRYTELAFFDEIGFALLMKKILVAGFFSLLLAGCGGNDAPDVNYDLTVQRYDGGAFSIDVPRDWQVIERNNMTWSIPTETVVAFRNNVKNPFFIASIVVSKFITDAPLANEDFATLMIQKHQDTVFDYTELGRETATLRAGGADFETVIFSFQGRDSFDGDLTVFREVYLATPDHAYVVTAAHGQSEDAGVVIQLEDALKSFQLL